MANVRLRDLDPAVFLNAITVGETLSTEGNMGVGCAAGSTYRIKVEDTTDAQILLRSLKTNGWVQLSLIPNGTGDAWLSYGTYGKTQSLKFWSYTSSTNFEITHDGKVGIGTDASTPTEMLVLNSASNTRMVVQEAGADKGSIGAGGSGLYIRNLAGAILFRNIADGTNMKIFDNGHITFGSANNVGGQNHTFNPSASYNQSYCSVAFHVPGMAANKKNWCMRAHPLSGSTSYSYFQFRPLNDDGSDHGDGTFFFNHLFSDIVFKSSNGYNCQLDVESVSSEASVRLRGNTVGAGADWHLWAGGGANDFRIFRNGDTEDCLALRALSTNTSGTGEPGGVFVGTTDTSGGGITWGNKSRMLKIVGDSDSGGGSKAGAGIVLYDSEEGNHARSWAIYQQGLLYNTRLTFQFGENVDDGCSLNYYGTWGYRGGVQQTAFFDYTNSENNSTTRYLHVKTNIKKSSSAMFHIKMEGYAYYYAKIIDSTVVGFMYNAYTNENLPCNVQIRNNEGTTQTVSIKSMYCSSPGDGEHLVIILEMPPNVQTHCGFVLSAIMACPDAYGRGFIVEGGPHHVTTSYPTEEW